MRLGFEGMVNVDCAGRAGGLAFLWKKADEFSLLGFSQNHIDMAVLENKTPQWKITGFYGHLDRSQRSTTSDLPWCVIGDFNEICNNEAKRGTIPHLPQLITRLPNDIDQTLTDPKYVKGNRGSNYHLLEFLSQSFSGQYNLCQEC